MKTSQFTDKQIMDLSNSKSNDEFINLMYPPPQDDNSGSGKKEEIVPSYDFQPIRPNVAKSQQSNLDSSSVGGARVWNSADSKTNTAGIGTRIYTHLDSIEPAKVVSEKDHSANNTSLLSEIDQTMKKHADNLLHAMEGVSARISQLESRTRNLENSMDDLKVSFGNNYGSTDGKLRQLENILREVQTDVQVVRDKQDIVEGQIHLVKLQVSKAEQQSETLNAVHPDSLHQAASASQRSYQQLPLPPVMQAPSHLSVPINAPPPASQQSLAPSGQLPNQFAHNQNPSVPQRESYFSPPSQTQEVTSQQYQLPPPEQLQPAVPTPPQQQYPPPHPQYSQPPAPPQQHPSLSAVNPSQHQPQPQSPFPLGHHPDEAPYAPPHNYPPSLRQPPHPPSGNPPGAPSHMYETPSSKPNSGYTSAYGPPSGDNEPYSYSGSASHYGGGGPSQYSGGSMKQQHLSSAAAQGGGSSYSYSQLPTARILPQVLPTASGVGGGSGSSETGNRVPIDDVVDKVTNMGFPRDQVRATVRKLTENGQAVDLNIVLDKLMNDGSWLAR